MPRRNCAECGARLTRAGCPTCGTAATKPADAPAASAYHACAWGSGVCRLPAEVFTAGSWLCAWHHACARTSARAADDREEFDRYVTATARRYCALLSHYTPEHLWAVVHGDADLSAAAPQPCAFSGPTCLIAVRQADEAARRDRVTPFRRAVPVHPVLTAPAAQPVPIAETLPAWVREEAS